jgi:hypothetical protein
LFPADPDLHGLNAVSYMGMRTESWGILAVLDTRTPELNLWIESVFRILVFSGATWAPCCRASQTDGFFVE